MLSGRLDSLDRIVCWINKVAEQQLRGGNVGYTAAAAAAHAGSIKHLCPILDWQLARQKCEDWPRWEVQQEHSRNLFWVINVLNFMQMALNVSTLC